MKAHRFIPIALLALGTPARAQLEVVSQQILPTGEIRLVIDDPSPLTTSYRFQFAPDPSGPWTQPAGVGSVDLGNGRTRFTAPDPGTPRAFYRVLGLSGSADDPDGDGLSTQFETSTTSTDPFAFDSDSDGFGDGQEFALGTDPNDPDDFPGQTTLPTIEFATSLSSTTEGAGTHHVTLQISPAYTGTVHYTLNTRSTAASPGDFQPLSGTLTASGTSASIPVTLVDDASVSVERLIVLDLATSPTGTYRRGGRATHVVCLGENDSYYNGTLLGTSGGERNFRLRVLRSPGSTSTAFVAGSADGLNAPAGVDGSQSDGVIPTSPSNVWQATAEIDTPSRFRAVSPKMPVPSAALFTSTAQLQRRLTLDATDPALITATTIYGNYSEVISSADPAKTYLNETATGTFVLVKDVPGPADVASEFQP